MMKYFSLILAFFSLVTSYGCAKGVKTLDQKYIEHARSHNPEDNLASLYIYREYTFGGSAVEFAFYIDNKKAAQLGTDQFALFTLTPGLFKYAFKLYDQPIPTDDECKSINVEGGHAYYLKCKAGMPAGECQKITNERGRILIDNSHSLVEPLIKEFQSKDYIAYQKVEQENSKSSYEHYIKNNPNSAYVVNAKRKTGNIKIEEEKEFIVLIRSQKCKLKEKDWAYLGSSCKDNYADGNGEAIHKDQKLSFKGVIKQGKRVKGILSYKNVPLFDGKIVNGKADGKGVCFHEGEPEECKFYKGKRIDSLFKQRIEMAKQAKKMDDMNKKIDGIKATQAYGQVAGQDNSVGAAVKKEVGKKIGSMIFDQLF